MKKILILLAAAMLVVACGNSGNKKSTIEQTTEKYVKAQVEAYQAQDWDKLEEIQAEIQKWAETLTEEEREQVDAYGEKLFKELTEKSAGHSDVEEQAAEFATKLCEAEMDADYSKLQKLQEEMMEWISGLSEEESTKAEAAFMKAVEKWQEEHAAEFDEEEWG